MLPLAAPKKTVARARAGAPHVKGLVPCLATRETRGPICSPSTRHKTASSPARQRNRDTGRTSLGSLGPGSPGVG